MKGKICRYLDDKHIKHANMGFDYLIQSIEIGLEDKSKVTKSITKTLYPEIAERNNITAHAAERCMRHSILSTGMTVSEFIAKAVDDIKYGEVE